MSDTFFIENLVKTVDKKELLLTLRQWRSEAVENAEADLLKDLIELVVSGDIDG